MSTLNEINQKARQALLSALGPVDYTRYQQQFSQGSGDYTDGRRQSLKTDTAAIIQEVTMLKASGYLIPPPNAKTVLIES